MKMTIDEAIEHCMEVAEQNETKALRISWQNKGTLLDREAKECRRCAAEHRQLAEWLRELQELRSLKSDYVIFRAEAKRLLELALQDLAEADHCGLCKHEPDDIATCQRKPINCFVWRYSDEAEKLFKEGMKWISI